MNTETKTYPPIPPEITTDRGLLWRARRVIHLPEADAVAHLHGFQHAEAMVRHLEQKKPAPEAS